MHIHSFSYKEITSYSPETIQCLRDALEASGFFYLSALPMTNNFLDKLMLLSREFFELPQEKKEEIHINKSQAFRGYSPLGAEKTNGKCDFKETIDFGPELPLLDKALHGPNQWPCLPLGLSDHLKVYYGVLQQIGFCLMENIALSYGKDKDYFSNQFKGEPFSLLRLLCYPQTKEGEFGIGPHADYGCLNCLYQDNSGGLELENDIGEWYSVSPRPYHLIINAGDMLSYWTNHQIRSMPHRVIHTSQTKRISIPFFFEPGFDTLVKPMDKIAEPIHYGSHLLKAYQRSFEE
jgi:isopenicillin N synthase-like dioxygenase